ncbi:MAG: DUF3616 domain-containing protein [Nostoc sp. LLA-1]|nr:DUF3616 domain-containing protein [Cyanocohniella sp. LLY]
MKNLKFTVEKELQHYEICDSSGAIALDEQHFVVADDEDNILRVYQANISGKPVVRIDINNYFTNNPDKSEVDIEGATEIDGIIYWITSHARNKNGRFKQERHQLFANKLKSSKDKVFEQVGKSYTQLVIKDILNENKLKKYQFNNAEKLPPKEPGGLNIEGLTITPNKELLIGFRNPIFQDKALLISLKNPLDLLEKEGVIPIFGDVIELPLDGLGIRSIEYLKSENQYIIVAGAYDGSEQFALYQWSGLDESPQLIEGIDFPADFRPEAVLFYPNRTNELHLLSDDGTIKRNGDISCKKIKNQEDSQKYFRSIWVRIHQ